MAKDCLYCGLQFSDTTNFCSNCGRPTERDFIIRPNQESELDRLRKEIQEKDDLIRQLVLARTMPGEARSTARRDICSSDGSRESGERNGTVLREELKVRNTETSRRSVAGDPWQTWVEGETVLDSDLDSLFTGASSRFQGTR